MKYFTIFTVIMCAILSVSCIGVDAKVKISENSSVDMSIEYSIALAVDNLGKLGANAATMPLPVTRADLELAVLRSGGELKSWTRKDDANAIKINANIFFQNINSFVKFLDPTGKKAVYNKAGASSSLTLTLSEGIKDPSPELVDFLKLAFDNYSVALLFSLPNKASASSDVVCSGKGATFTMKAADLYITPRVITISW